GSSCHIPGREKGGSVSILRPASVCRQSKITLQSFEHDVLELDALVVALEADMPLLAQDAGMALAMLFDVVVEVGIDELGAVLLNEDAAAFGDDAHLVPLTDLLVGDLGGRDDIVDRTGVLPRL